MFDFDNSLSYCAVNPRLPLVNLPDSWQGYSSLPGHLWVATSGTTKRSEEGLKWVALSKKALLISAEAVNCHFNLSAKDRLGVTLPLFHVGGISILARGHLLGAKVHEYSWGYWEPFSFERWLAEEKITVCSLVPTQLHDLVKKQCQPQRLRLVMIGGGALDEGLKNEARRLGWPLALTYGMTECSSQIASGQVGDDRLVLLPHIEAKVDRGRLCLKSSALFSGYLKIKKKQFQWEDPKQEGWFLTDDKVEMEDRTLRFLERTDDRVKIKGENVSLGHLNRVLEGLKSKAIEAVVLALEDQRAGFDLVLGVVGEDGKYGRLLAERLNERVMPYERVARTILLREIPKNEMGKKRFVINNLFEYVLMKS